jgi:hypothetical protein
MIKKFRLFENKSNLVSLKEDIVDIFLEFIDEHTGIDEVEPMEVQEERNRVVLWISFNPSNDQYIDFDKYFKNEKDRFDRLKKVKSCIDRLKSMYKDIVVAFDLDKDYYCISFSLFDMKGDYYVKSGNIIKLDRGELMKITPDIEAVNVWSGSNPQNLEFVFDSERHLESYKDQLIPMVQNLKIFDDYLITESPVVVDTWSKKTEMIKFKVQNNHSRSYSSNRGNRNEIINSVIFYLNPKYKFE